MRGSLRQIIFDFDGTLIDSAPDLAVAINAMLRELEYPPVTQEQIRLWIGNGAAKLVERALKARAITAISTDAALTSFYHHYHRALGQYSKLYPGVEQGLRQLHQAGFTLSLCTNKPEQFTSPLLQRFLWGFRRNRITRRF
jgi:phosphoglycolate phosphatase